MTKRAPKTLSPTDFYALGRGLVIALVAVVVGFAITIGVVLVNESNRSDEVCDVVADAFHEQAILFGEFSQRPPDDPELVEYDERLQAVLASC